MSWTWPAATDSGAAYGSGAALIIDEAALLIDLKDVYWGNDGRKSVDVAIVTAGGAYLAAIPFWHTAAREGCHQPACVIGDLRYGPPRSTCPATPTRPASI